MSAKPFHHSENGVKVLHRALASKATWDEKCTCTGEAEGVCPVPKVCVNFMVIHHTIGKIANGTKIKKSCCRRSKKRQEMIITYSPCHTRTDFLFAVFFPA